MPYFMALAGGGIGNPNRPRLRLDRNQRLLLLRARGLYIGDQFAVRRPARQVIFIYTGREIARPLPADVIHADQAVITAIANEGNTLPIRRPFRSEEHTSELQSHS